MPPLMRLPLWHLVMPVRSGIPCCGRGSCPPVARIQSHVPVRVFPVIAKLSPTAVILYNRTFRRPNIPVHEFG